MDFGLSSEPPSQSVEGSTTNPMNGGGAEVGVDDQLTQSTHEEKATAKNANTSTPQNQIPIEGTAASIEQNVEEEVVLKRKRQKTSKVWDDFVEVTLPNDIKKAQCIHCKAKLSQSDTGTTSTLKRHSDKCAARRKYEETQQLLNFPPSRCDVETVRPLIKPDAKYDSNKMREAIAVWIMGTGQPFAVVEDDLFVNMMKTATPFFEKISRVTTKSDCFKVYEHEKKKLKALTKAASKISLTTDCWKSTHQKIEYMVITGHFIDQNWRLQKRVLSFVHVPPPRTGLDIADAIYKCLKEWEIEDKVFTISVDNASYNDSALRNLKETFSRVRKLACGGRLFHVKCCAHILNLLVRDGLSKIDTVIANVREGIKYINHSDVRLQKFSNVIQKLKIKDRKLLLDVATRWNSTYDMLVVALKFKDAFPSYAEYDLVFSHLPTEEEWKNVESVCEILKVFKVCTNIISGSDYPTANLYLVEVFQVKQTLDKGAESTNIFIRDMVIKMKEKFDKYWGECHLVMAIASILDPRFKMKLVEFCFPTIYPDAVENIAEVKKALYEMYSEYLEMHDASVREAAKTHGCGVNVSGSNEGTSFGSGMEAFGKFIKSANLKRPEKSELDMYLEEGVYIEQDEKGMDSFKALEWWNVHKLKYRVLSKIAMDVLAIPISTVASEATFSAGGRDIDPYRSSLLPDSIEKLICGGDWIRQLYGIKKKLKKEEIPVEVLLPGAKS